MRVTGNFSGLQVKLEGGHSRQGEQGMWRPRGRTELDSKILKKASGAEADSEKGAKGRR